jgi:GTP-sensing pleiotropic transcriptional regulator CodY
MSRGIGDTQRAILTELADAAEEGAGVWAHALADRLGITRSQLHTAVRGLRSRGLADARLRGWSEEPPLVAGRALLVFLVPTG